MKFARILLAPVPLLCCLLFSALPEATAQNAPPLPLPSNEPAPFSPQPLFPLPDAAPLLSEPSLLPPLPSAKPEVRISSGRQEAPSQDDPNPTEEAARKLARRVRFRELKARCLALPEIAASLRATQSAPSDRMLRERLLAHYSLLYSRMQSLDPSLQTLIQQERRTLSAPLQPEAVSLKP